MSGLSSKPDIDIQALCDYRMSRLLAQMQALEVPACMLVNPVSLRYAINYSNYALFSAHIPCTYLLLAADGEYLLHNAFDPKIDSHRKRVGQAIAHFYGGQNLAVFAARLSQDIKQFYSDHQINEKRIAVEHVNPSITLALQQSGFQVLDGALVSEQARLIKSKEEIECIKWAVKVAEHGADQVKAALKPGVRESQLWGLLNYTNLANCGEWHDGKMLASGPRINPWLQEVSDRKVQAGDLLGFDTDMVGPMGYFADLSRTFYCGPGKPTARQKELYRMAFDEVHANLALIKDGVSFASLQENAYAVPPEFQKNAYPCIIHGVGMCDEYPHIHPAFRGEIALHRELGTGNDVLRAGMVVCVESYMGAEGERDGVKLEQQVLVTETGYQLLTEYPFEEALLSSQF